MILISRQNKECTSKSGFGRLYIALLHQPSPPEVDPRCLLDLSANRTRGWATRHRQPGADLCLSVCPACLTQAHALPPCREGAFHPAHSHRAARSRPCTALCALWWSGRGWSHAHATVQPGLLAYFLLPRRLPLGTDISTLRTSPSPAIECWPRPRRGARQEGGWASEGEWRAGCLRLARAPPGPWGGGSAESAPPGSRWPRWPSRPSNGG